MAPSIFQSSCPSLDASAQPLMAALADSPTFREFAEAFRGAFALVLELVSDRDHDRWVHNACGHCLLRRLPAPCDRSIAVATGFPAGLQKGRGSAESMVGRCGRVVSMVPVRTGGQVIGWLATGGIFTVTPNPEDPARILFEPMRSVTPLRRRRLRDACAAIRTMPVAQYDAILRLLIVFADHLACLAGQMAMASEHAESPAMAKVKDYIRQNMGNEITVAECARRAHMSKSYFCRTFKRATGLVFTEYLARTRAEAARVRIAHSQVRVTEVAFAVGFQSLSQFNRVFKRLTGRCPSVYRRVQDSDVLLSPGRSDPAIRSAALRSPPR